MGWTSSCRLQRPVTGTVTDRRTLKEYYCQSGGICPAAGSKILGNIGIRLVVVTMGPDGCYYRYGDNTGHLNTYDIKVSDTTGAGDAFLGGLLYWVSRREAGLDGMDIQELLNILDFANTIGALCSSRRGAIPIIGGEYCLTVSFESDSSD